MRRQKNIQILEDTLDILEKGSYTKDGQDVRLRFSLDELRKIRGMLLVAASHGYRHLILGAFGYGVYGNDAATISDLFSRAIRNLSYAGTGSSRLFDSIDFAVLCHSDEDYNYVMFCRNFGRKE